MGVSGGNKTSAEQEAGVCREGGSKVPQLNLFRGPCFCQSCWPTTSHHTPVWQNGINVYLLRTQVFFLSPLDLFHTSDSRSWRSHKVNAGFQDQINSDKRNNSFFSRKRGIHTIRAQLYPLFVQPPRAATFSPRVPVPAWGHCVLMLLLPVGFLLCLWPLSDVCAAAACTVPTPTLRALCAHTRQLLPHIAVPWGFQLISRERICLS
ncbi:hypothetical protein AV530_019473 [Patagioenas fasciata monilis]|uniref:Uncharacterized protein n=1 Tax=Patagioenas fasciata monilis TaxID=372326 RepID=A0A1V4JE37_PATFA|nr:hypothetical protein AV530_019473 [Patagioenas fasciata monilis]